MFKKIISIILTVAVVCSLVVPAVYADEPDCLTNGHSFSDPPGIMKGFDGEIQGFPVKVSIKYCSKCKFYFHECDVLGIKLEYMSLTGFTGIDGELQAFLFTQIGRIMGSNASASQFQAGGGSASPGGVGRHPAGYAGEGTPSYNVDGDLFVLAQPIFYATGDEEKTPVGSGRITSRIGSIDFSCPFLSYRNVDSNPQYFIFSRKSDPYQVAWYFTCPVDGVYFINDKIYISSSSEIDRYIQKFSYKCKSGDKIYLYHNYSENGFDVLLQSNSSLKIKLDSIPVKCIPDKPPVTKNTNITINNNTWNGNIYVDNTNKLTYIYPQYTVNNETKISNNPIIYNEETKQYYTYDSVTNNYYYITYGDPAPTPTPSPSPDPGGSTPDPDKPTPTPIPGGSDSSGGGSGLNPLKWLAELLKDIVEGIFKAIWKLITSIFGFLIWLVSLLGMVLPFIPAEGLAALSAAAIIITVIRIIKFILGR